MNHESNLERFAELLSKYNSDNEEIRQLLQNGTYREVKDELNEGAFRTFGRSNNLHQYIVSVEDKPIITPEEAERIVEFYNNDSNRRKELTENVQDITYSDISKSLIFSCRFRYMYYRVWFKVSGDSANRLEGFIINPAYSVNKMTITKREDLIPSIKDMINQVENFIRG